MRAVSVLSERGMLLWNRGITSFTSAPVDEEDPSSRPLTELVACLAVCNNSFSSASRSTVYVAIRRTVAANEVFEDHDGCVSDQTVC
jgi:hypothetical protein